MRDVKVNGRKKITKEKSKRALKKSKRQRKEKIWQDETDKKRERTGDREWGSESRQSEGDADKEYIMKLCSAGSVKGSNLLIKDKDWFVTRVEKKAQSMIEKLQPSLYNSAVS